MRSRLVPWVALLTLTAAGAAAAAGYGLTAPKRYRATAQLLVAPVSPGDPTFAGIGVLRDTGGKRTAAADVAALLRAPQIVDAVAAQLALKRSGKSLLDALDAHVVDSSDVVAVTAEDTSADGAAQLANTFANALIAQRSAAFQSQLANAIRRDEKLLAVLAPAQRSAAEGTAITRRLTTLRGFQGQPDPTLQLASQAAAPKSSSWPRLPSLVGIGAGAGAALGLLVAIALVALRRRGRVGLGQYDRPVSEEALEKLVDRLEARLVARESALIARERDLQAALDELRAARSEATGQDEQEELEELARRREELDRRDGELDRRDGELDRRDGELDRRDGELDRRDGELAEQQGELAKRVEAVTKREVELARRAAALAMRDRERTAREQARPEPEPEPLAVAAVTAPEPVPAGGGHYNLLTLERLVEDRGAEFPDRLDEWTSYLFFLREHAAADGSVSANFDWLIQDTFAELVA